MYLKFRIDGTRTENGGRKKGTPNKRIIAQRDIIGSGMISARTKAALAAAKRRGVKLGGDRGARLTAKARAAGRAAVQERGRHRALDLAPTLRALQAGRREA